MDYKYPSSAGHSNIFFKLAFEVLKEKKTRNVRKGFTYPQFNLKMQFHTGIHKYGNKMSVTSFSPNQNIVVLNLWSAYVAEDDSCYVS
jgi:hypothetical protein